MNLPNSHKQAKICIFKDGTVLHQNGASANNEEDGHGRWKMFAIDSEWMCQVDIVSKSVSYANDASRTLQLSFTLADILACD